MDIPAEALLMKIKNETEKIAPLLLVYGEDDYYRLRINAALPAALFADTPPEDRAVSVFAKDTDLGALENAINSYPFFCARSLVILQDEKLLAAADPARAERLLAILGDIPPHCTVLVSVKKLDKRTKLFKSLKKNAWACECSPLRPDAILPWLRAQAALHGARWQGDAVGRIMEYLQPADKAPLALLEQEIAKLAAYAGERKEWSSEDVDNIFSALPEASGFAVLKALGKRDLKQVLEILASERKQGTSVLSLAALLQFKLRQMAQYLELAGRGYNYQAILAEMKLSPFIGRNLQREVRGFRLEALSRALIELAQLNIDIRKGGREYARLEEILLTLLRA